MPQSKGQGLYRDAHMCGSTLCSSMLQWECGHMPRILKAHHPSAHCQRIITKHIPRTPQLLPREVPDWQLQVPEIVGERSTDIKSGTKTYDLWLEAAVSCGPSAKRWKRESENSGENMREQKAEAHKTQLNPQSHAHTYMVWSHTTLVCLKHFHHLRVWEEKTEH